MRIASFEIQSQSGVLSVWTVQQGTGAGEVFEGSLEISVAPSKPYLSQADTVASLRLSSKVALVKGTAWP